MLYIFRKNYNIFLNDGYGKNFVLVLAHSKSFSLNKTKVKFSLFICDF